MNILIFGASGRTGSLLVNQALQQNHHVTAFVRPSSRIIDFHPNLEIVKGSLKDKKFLRKVLKDKEAVLSTLGVSKTLHHDPEVIEGISNIVNAASAEETPRFIYESVFLVGSKAHEFSFFANQILRRIIRHEVEDHQIKEDLICKGLNNYTIVRPVRLTNVPFSGKFYHGTSITSNEFLPSIGRADVAHFMLQQLKETTYLNQCVRLMKNKSSKHQSF
jgi:nucleoside-diphosphate-sugar epimerase